MNQKELIPEPIKPMNQYSNDDIIGLHTQAISQSVLFETPIWLEREHIFCAELKKRMEK